jgi:ATP adenylyltransferase
MVIMNKYPYNNGHLMIVPNHHTAELGVLSEEMSADMFGMTKICVAALKETYRPEGYNIGMNLGVSGGAGIHDHLHLHIVPRWLGDTNFMPILAETKAMPQHLLSSYDQMQTYFRRL